MFEFIDRHKVGILTTIIIHLIFVTVFMAVQFSSITKQKEKQVTIDFVDEEKLQKQIEEKKQEVKQLAQRELSKEIREQLHNVPVNEAEKEAVKSVDQMVKDIKGELNIKDRKVIDDNAIAQKQKDVAEKKETPKVEKQTYTTNKNGERSFTRGNTTISFFLEGRNPVYLPVPVYKCLGSGKVVVEIIVNSNGFVVSTNINKAASNTTEDCIVEAAKKAALTSRFNASTSAPDKQTGKITYTFIAQ